MKKIKTAAKIIFWPMAAIYYFCLASSLWRAVEIPPQSIAVQALYITAMYGGVLFEIGLGLLSLYAFKEIIKEITKKTLLT